MQINMVEIIAAFMVLFAIIDIPGSIPVILDIKAKSGDIEPVKATMVSFVIFLAFLYIGSPLLGIFGIDVSLFERILGQGGLHLLKKVFGIILLSIAIKLFLTNTGIVLPHVM